VPAVRCIDRWSELKRNDDGNSHLLMLDTYMRMLAEYRRIMDGRRRGLDRHYLLTLDELQQIAEARVHPSNRRAGGGGQSSPTSGSRSGRRRWSPRSGGWNE